MATLGDFITIKHGYAFKGTEITTEDNGVVLVTPGNFAIGGGFKEEKCKFFNGEYPVEYVLSPDDLIVTMTDLSKDMDTLGYSALIPFSGRTYLHNQRIGLINIKEESVDKHYLYWFMRTHKYQRTIAGGASGTTVHHTSPTRICEIEVDFPDIETQQSIAMILGALDDKIALNQQINKNLEEQAQAIFKAWFVDFEPFGGEMPTNWTYRTLGDIATVSSGKRPPMKSDVKTKETHIPIVGASSVMGFTNEANHSDKILVIGRVGTHGIVQRFNRPCWTSDNTLVLTSQHYEYVYQILRTIDYASLNRGSTQPLITQSDIKKLEILLPTESIARNFEGIVEDLMLLHEENISENEKLSNLRDALLPRLMSGEIDVSGIEI